MSGYVNTTRVVPPQQPMTMYQLTRQNTLMRTTLLQAAEQFKYYEEQHLAKDPPDTAKSVTNKEWAERCLSATKLEV